MLVLGIETSCDETAAAIVDDAGTIHADMVLSQLDEHRPYGGVVPEIAARAHLDHIDRLIKAALDKAGIAPSDLDAIAATSGPGLIGGVMVGAMTGKAIASVLGKPFIAVNHLEGHALTARLTDKICFPYLLLLVSGGHCQLLIVKGVGQYQRLGSTLDDAAGEAFDKAAKMLDLGYPGGPAVQKAAQMGDPARFDLPRPMKGRPGCDFSFSGLKNAVRLLIAEQSPLTDQDRFDIAASFQRAVSESIGDRTRRAMKIFADFCSDSGIKQIKPVLVVSGGVAANQELRAALTNIAEIEGFSLIAPPLSLCTDNGAMIAWAGLERFRLGYSDGMDFAPRPRWPLDPDAKTLPGAGGAKA